MVITYYGGNTTNSNAQALLELSPTQNAWASPSIPFSAPYLVNHGAATRLTDGTVYLFGGSIGTTAALNTLYAIDVGSGSISPLSSAPISLLHPAVIWYPATGHIVVMGGTIDGVNSVPLTALFVYDTTANNWTTVKTTGITPTPRFRHTAVVTADNVIVYGGQDGAGNPLADFAVLDMSGYPNYAPSWFMPQVKGNPPPGRYGHTYVFFAFPWFFSYNLS